MADYSGRYSADMARIEASLKLAESPTETPLESGERKRHALAAADELERIARCLRREWQAD